MVTLPCVIITQGSDSSDSSDSDDSSDEDEAPPPTGKRLKGNTAAAAAVAGAAKGGKGKGKGKGVVHHRDGTVASASEAELKIAANLAKDPWGR